MPFLHCLSIVSPRASIKEYSVNGKENICVLLQISSSRKNLGKHCGDSPSPIAHILYLMFFGEGNSSRLDSRIEQFNNSIHDSIHEFNSIHDSIPETVAILKSSNRWSKCCITLSANKRPIKK